MRNAVPLFSTDWLPAVWPSFGRPAGVAGDHLDAVERQVELLGRDLGERGQDALAELDLAGEDGRGAVGVDADPAVELAVVLQAAGQPRRLLRERALRIEREGDHDARRARR